MGTNLDSVGSSKEDHPGRKMQSQLLNPHEPNAETKTQNHLNKNKEGRGRQEQTYYRLFQAADNTAKHRKPQLR
jgi:hypothetical protein